MHRLRAVDSMEDIFSEYRNTPIEHLLEYHNLGRPFQPYDHPELLIGKCMDYRERLRMPDNFAYVIRAGGANLRYSEFSISYAIAVGEVYAIALIGHNNCGMVNLMSKKEAFIQGLKQHEGWDEERATEHFMHFAPMFEIDNEIDFALSEAQRLRSRYPHTVVAPMMYKVEDRRLYLIAQ